MINKQLVSTNNELIHLKYFIILSLLTYSITAIYITNFKTIFFPGLFIAFFVSKNELKQINWKRIIPFLLSFILFFVFYHLQFLFDNYHITNSHGDHSFYSQVSAYINYTGVESFYFDYTNSNIKSPLPYHYGENWTTIIFSNIFGLNEFKTQEFITIPTLLSLGFSFIFLLLSKFTKNIFHAISLAFVIVIGSSSYFWTHLHIKFISDFIEQFTFTFYNFPKFAFSFFCSSIIIYSIFSNKISIKKETLLATSFASLGCISFVPVLVIFIAIYLRDNKQFFDKNILFAGFVIIYYGLFYGHFGLESSNINPVSKNLLGDCISIPLYLKTCFNITFKTLLQLFFVSLPFILFTIFYIGIRSIKSVIIENKQTIFLLFIILLVGIFSWAILWLSMGSISLFIDGSYALYRVFILVFILYLLFKKQTSNLKKNLIVIVFIGLCINGFVIFFKPKALKNESKIVTNLKQELTYNSKPFIYLRDYNTDGPIYRKNLLANTSFGNLSIINPNNQGVFVDIENIKKSSDCLENMREEKFLSTAPYFNYKIKNTGTSVDILEKFISENNIKYLIADSDSINLVNQNSILVSVIKKHILFDNEEGLHLYQLR